MFKRGIFFLADGARFDVMEAELAKGHLPNISRYLVAKGGLRKATTVFPSTTGPAYLPFLAGRFPGPCNLTGIRWFDRAEYAKPNFSIHKFRSYVGVESALMSRDITPVKSVFNHCSPAFNVFSTISPGATFSGNATKWIRMAFCYYAHVTHEWRVVDEAAKNRVLNILAKDAPEFIFSVFPAIDEYAHLTSPFSEKTLQAYRDFDRHVSDIAGQLEKDGHLDDTLLVISADHGLSDTHTHFPVEKFLESHGLKTFYYPLIYRRNFDAAIAVSGNGMAHLYFRGEKGWASPFDLVDLETQYPILLGDLIAQPAVEFVAAKNGSGEGREVWVISREGRAKISHRQGRYHFENISGSALGIADFPKEGVSSEMALQLTFETTFPDAVVQLWQIFESPRAGDLIVTAKMGFDLRERFERPEHHASHGALHWEHMHVPFMANLALAQEPMRTVDIFPTMMQALGKDVDAHRIEGVSRLADSRWEQKGRHNHVRS